MTETPDFDNVKELLTQLHRQDYTTLSSIDEIVLRVVAFHPQPRWQCNVTFRDRTRPWGTAVGITPEETLTRALGIALRGPEAIRKESTALFHLRREKAMGMQELYLEEYPDLIAAAQVEFEPYRGWVLVLFPKPGADLSFLEDRVEVRQFQVAGPAQKSPVRVVTTADVVRAEMGQPLPVPAGGRASMPKDALDAEYKRLKGKFPPREWKKAELARRLDEMEASGEN